MYRAIYKVEKKTASMKNFLLLFAMCKINVTRNEKCLKGNYFEIYRKSKKYDVGLYRQRIKNNYLK